mgnify:CR=1 FL=1
MGGVGKTELATQYAIKYKSYYDAILRFNFTSNDLFTQVLRFFKFTLGYQVPQKTREGILNEEQQVKHCWDNYPNLDLPVLVIFDNVDDAEKLRKIIPNDQQFRCVVTTQKTRLDSKLIIDIPINILSLKEAVTFLQLLLGATDKRISSERTKAESICNFLECLPLAIELVGGYLAGDPYLCLGDMMEKLEKEKLNHTAFIDKDKLTIGVRVAFSLTWSKLSSNAKQLGKLISLFPAKKIHWDYVQLVIEFPTKEEEELPIWDNKCIDEGKRELHRRNIIVIQQDSIESYYQVHSLLRYYLQEQLTEENETNLILISIFVRFIEYNSNAMKLKMLHTKKTYLKEIAFYMENIAQELLFEINQNNETGVIYLNRIKNDQIISIFLGIGSFYLVEGLYESAELWLDRSINACKLLSLENKVSMIHSLNALAMLYVNQGKYSEAESLFDKLFTIAKTFPPEEDLNIDTCWDNLALLYQYQGREKEAGSLLSKSLGTVQDIEVADSPILARRKNNLAHYYMTIGKYEEALPLFIESLEMRQRLFKGEDHPDIAISLDNLGLLYYYLRKPEQAEPISYQALEMRKRLFDKNHPDIARSSHNLGLIYSYLRKPEQAKPLFIKSLQINKANFGEAHPDIATSMDSLSNIYKFQGNWKEAEYLCSKSLEMRQRLFKEDHPSKARNLMNLALLYELIWGLEEAYFYIEQALEMADRILEANDPLKADIQNNFTRLSKKLAFFPLRKRRFLLIIILVLIIVLLSFSFKKLLVN